MELPRFAVVDIETSGMSSRRHRILQIGVVLTEADGTIVQRWSSLVRLRHRLSRVGPTHVHGITRSMLRHAPQLDGLLDELGPLLDGAVFTAHNAAFDGEFLQRACRRRPTTDPVRRALEHRLCTLRLSRMLDPDRTMSHRLSDVCDRYGVPLHNAHDALADAEATAGILPHLLEAHGVATTADLDALYDSAPTSSLAR